MEGILKSSARICKDRGWLPYTKIHCGRIRVIITAIGHDLILGKYLYQDGTLSPETVIYLYDEKWEQFFDSNFSGQK